MTDLVNLRKIAENATFADQEDMTAGFDDFGGFAVGAGAVLALLDRVEKSEGELDLMEQTLDLSKMVEDKVKKKLDWAEQALQRVRAIAEAYDQQPEERELCGAVAQGIRAALEGGE